VNRSINTAKSYGKSNYGACQTGKMASITEFLMDYCKRFGLPQIVSR